jgi:hypothetical protein
MTRDRDERRAVHPCVSDRRDEVRRARSARRDAHAHSASSTGARVAFGGVTRALFVPAEHVMQAIAVAVQRVVERHDRAAGYAEHHAHTFADERLTHDLRAGQHESTAP